MFHWHCLSVCLSIGLRHYFSILFPRACVSFGQHQETRGSGCNRFFGALWLVFILPFQPIRTRQKMVATRASCFLVLTKRNAGSRNEITLFLVSFKCFIKTQRIDLPYQPGHTIPHTVGWACTLLHTLRAEKMTTKKHHKHPIQPKVNEKRTEGKEDVYHLTGTEWCWAARAKACVPLTARSLQDKEKTYQQQHFMYIGNNNKTTYAKWLLTPPSAMTACVPYDNLKDRQ